MKRLLAIFVALMAFAGLALGAVNVNTATKPMPNAQEEMKAQSKPEPATAAKGEIKRAPHEAAQETPKAKPETAAQASTTASSS